jgi:Cu2+-exporting ATPase/Cu+-exporting ATPase
MAQEVVKDILETKAVQCSHCNDSTIHPIIDGDESFCCYGCQTIFHALKEKDLLHYYKLRDAAEGNSYSPRENFSKKDFSFMNDEKFQKEFIKLSSNGLELKLYLEGIHCVACVWLLEKAPTFIEGIKSARVQLGLSTIELVIEPGSDISRIASEIHKMGYIPHPVKTNDEALELQQSTDRMKLIQIGVAAACSANIMLYSVAIYAGAGEKFASLFGWVSFFLSLPILLFSALPFYQSSIKALKNFSVNIDIPIAVALILGTVVGLYNLAIGSDHFYFDSLAILVFLLLSSRYIVHKTIQNGLNSRGLKSLFSNSTVNKLNKSTGEYESTHSDFINIGDTLLIKKGDTIPNDSVVLQGQSYINNSLITGESRPVKVKTEEYVYAGAQNISEEIVVKVDKDFSSSSLGKIIEKVESEHSEKLYLHSLTDKLSKWFVLSVFILSSVTFVYFLQTLGLHTAIERTLALIIISCPCALGLASPLGLAKAMSLAKSKGIVIKSEKTLEQLANTKDVFFDKTGTLTKGVFEVVNVNNIRDEKVSEIVYTLEKNSTHPIAFALKKWANTTTELPHTNFLETPGLGVSALINGIDYKLVKKEDNDSGLTSVNLIAENKVVCEFFLEDQLRTGSKDLIAFLNKENLNTHILSGDSNSCVESIASKLSIDKANVLGDMTPESKSKIMKQNSDSVMIGDGANDAIAMKEANVAISLRGAMDISLRASDIYLTNDPIKSIKELFLLAKQTYFSIKFNLILSITYNLLGVTLAVMGIINPLVAAILMPISSASVVIATLVNLRGKEL